VHIIDLGQLWFWPIFGRENSVQKTFQEGRKKKN
jgi:hypothetical protein